MNEGGAAGQPQLPAQLAVMAGGGFFLDVLLQRQHLLAAPQTVLARVGQAHAPRRALQQPGIEPLLQLADIARHHGAGHLQPVSRRAETAAGGHLGKHPQGGQSIHHLLDI